MGLRMGQGGGGGGGDKEEGGGGRGRRAGLRGPPVEKSVGKKKRKLGKVLARSKREEARDPVSKCIDPSSSKSADRAAAAAMSPLDAVPG